MIGDEKYYWWWGWEAFDTVMIRGGHLSQPEWSEPENKLENTRKSKCEYSMADQSLEEEKRSKCVRSDRKEEEGMSEKTEKGWERKRERGKR